MKRFVKLIDKVVRKIWGEDSFLYFTLIKLQYRWHPPLKDVDKILDTYANSINKVRFIQIGANDGKSGDPLFEYITKRNWTGVLVEPVGFLYEQLKNTYSGKESEVHFENVAIGQKKGKQIFYRLKHSAEINAPQWYDQLGSFNKDVLLKHKRDIPHIEELMVEEEVTTVTISDLMVKYDLRELELLHIDTEGYDYEIIKTFPFDITRPELILFEHKHLLVKSFQQCISLLRSHDYLLFSFDWDTIAIQKELILKIPGLVQSGDRPLSRLEYMNLLRYNSLQR
jgi:FkbM family methyltransferase